MADMSNLNIKQIEAIERGRALAREHDTATLIAAAMNSVSGNEKVGDKDAATVTAIMTTLFSIVSAE